MDPDIRIHSQIQEHKSKIDNHLLASIMASATPFCFGTTQNT